MEREVGGSDQLHAVTVLPLRTYFIGVGRVHSVRLEQESARCRCDNTRYDSASACGLRVCVIAHCYRLHGSLLLKYLIIHL